MCTGDLKEAFTGVDVALLVGSFPQGMDTDVTHMLFSDQSWCVMKRECDFVHFHFNNMTKFGERVCSLARQSNARSIILSRRRKEQRSLMGCVSSELLHS